VGGLAQQELCGIDASNARIFSENCLIWVSKRDFYLGASNRIIAGTIPRAIAETMTVAAAGALGGAGGMGQREFRGIDGSNACIFNENCLIWVSTRVFLFGRFQWNYSWDYTWGYSGDNDYGSSRGSRCGGWAGAAGIVRHRRLECSHFQ